MTWTDEKLDSFAKKVDTLIDGMNRQSDRISATVELQVIVAAQQAESIRLLIGMLNRKQA
ncbi:MULTISPECIES: hypothetical protein [Pseudanabaena]|uniref:Uncharacterized protein n=2 Tax=Pseudanabaena TaxID=1152 RepID=L8MX27_9CYAN|nr:MULTISPECIES: hypothetical protein [Pseudanabaena]ELS30553.1 hypothetical protein Pse7429DRAFT_4325 [Pseudanabaena biceps PCC 7429]MDG3497175.1 hypothetical protein [Pseudanabaena catenata USMAC16]